MKKFSAFLSLYLCACLLAACVGSRDGTNGAPQPAEHTAQTENAVLTCRIVTEEDGCLLLAGETGGSGAVYTLSLENTDRTAEGGAVAPEVSGSCADLPNGQLAGALVDIVFDGNIQESFPARLGGVQSVTIRRDGFNDLCGLYLRVLEDLWEQDAALNDRIACVGLDLERTSLSQAEQSAVSWSFACGHGAESVSGTWEQLRDHGYFTSEPIGTADAPAGAFWHWEDGCHYSIVETAREQETITFDAEKWRSSLGACFFLNCTAFRLPDGAWGDYTVGAGVIS